MSGIFNLFTACFRKKRTSGEEKRGTNRSQEAVTRKLVSPLLSPQTVGTPASSSDSRVSLEENVAAHRDTTFNASKESVARAMLANEQINVADIKANGCLLTDEELKEALAYYSSFLPESAFSQYNPPKLPRVTSPRYLAKAEALRNIEPKLPYSVQFFGDDLERLALGVHYFNHSPQSEMYSSKSIPQGDSGQDFKKGGVYCYGGTSKVRVMNLVPLALENGKLIRDTQAPSQWLANKVIDFGTSNPHYRITVDKVRNEAALTAYFLYHFGRIQDMSEVQCFVDYERKKCNVIMPWFGKDLFVCLQKDDQFTLYQVMDIFSQILEQIEIMRFLGNIHRDIKLENIFIKRTPEGKIIATLGDFGTAGAETESNNVHRGTLEYFAEYYYKSSNTACYRQNLHTDLHAAAIAMLCVLGYADKVTLEDGRVYIKLISKPDSAAEADEVTFFNFLKEFVLDKPRENRDEDYLMQKIKELSNLKEAYCAKYPDSAVSVAVAPVGLRA